MSEAARAVGSLKRGVRPLKPEAPDIWTAMGEVYTAASEAHSEAKKASAAVSDLVEAIGKPGAPDGGEPATGIFAHIGGLNVRLTKFERLWERGVGFALSAVTIGAPLVGALWWLAGDRISKLLQG